MDLPGIRSKTRTASVCLRPATAVRKDHFARIGRVSDAFGHNAGTFQEKTERVIRRSKSHLTIGVVGWSTLQRYR